MKVKGITFGGLITDHMNSEPIDTLEKLQDELKSKLRDFRFEKVTSETKNNIVVKLTSILHEFRYDSGLFDFEIPLIDIDHEDEIKYLKSMGLSAKHLEKQILSDPSYLEVFFKDKNFKSYKWGV